MSGKKPAKRAKRAKRKPSAKSSERIGVPQPHGGVLVPGAGGGPQPGSGRPKNEFKEWCKELLDDDSDVGSRKQVEAILKNKDHPAFSTMFREIANRAHGKPKEHLTLDATDNFADALEAARLRAKKR